MNNTCTGVHLIKDQKDQGRKFVIFEEFQLHEAVRSVPIYPKLLIRRYVFRLFQPPENFVIFLKQNLKIFLK